MFTLDATTIIFAIIAVFVALRLYSVLGTRTGNDAEDSPRMIRLRRAAQEAEAKRATTPAAEPAPSLAAPTVSPWKGLVPAGSEAEAGLTAIAKADPSFSPQSFLAGARAAYEMIVQAFAKGDLETLRRLLTPDAFANFNESVRARLAAGRTTRTAIVALNNADIVQAGLSGELARIAVRFAAKLVSATRDAQGAVVEGAADEAHDHFDVWTFVRNVRSRDPNWELATTEAAS